MRLFFNNNKILIAIIICIVAGLCFSLLGGGHGSVPEEQMVGVWNASQHGGVEVYITDDGYLYICKQSSTQETLDIDKYSYKIIDDAIVGSLIDTTSKNEPAPGVKVLFKRISVNKYKTILQIGLDSYSLTKISDETPNEIRP